MTTAPIFIVGPPRSGTTLTARILGRHSRIFTAGENHFFEDIYSRRRELGPLSDPSTKQRVIDRLATMYLRQNQIEDQERTSALLSDPRSRARLLSCESYSEILATFMSLHLDGTGKRRWTNHTPKDVFYVAEILSFYPDARFLFCVRDVRDFLLSYKNQWHNKGPGQMERLRDLYHPIVTSLLWKSTIKRIPRLEAMVPSRNMMVVRYESLVSESESTVRKICGVVGEEFEADMLNVDSHNSSHARFEKGIFSTSIGAWRGNLEPEEVFFAQRLNSRELAFLDYPIESSSARPAKIAKLVFTFPAALWRAIRANAHHRGPLLPYLNRRARALFGG